MTFRRAGRLPDAGVLLICWFRGTGAARHRCHAPPHDRRHARQDTKRVCAKRPDNGLFTDEGVGAAGASLAG